MLSRCFSASSPKQQSAGMHVAPLIEEATNTKFIVFGLTRPELEHTVYCTRFEHLTITTPMRFFFLTVEDENSFKECCVFATIGLFSLGEHESIVDLIVLIKMTKSIQDLFLLLSVI